MHLGLALLTLFPRQAGGSETYVRGLLGEFTAGTSPRTVTVLANARVYEDYRLFAKGPVRLHNVRSYRAGSRTFTRVLAMASATALPRITARDVPPDLDLVHYPVTVPLPRVRHPRVVTLHDLQHRDLPQMFGRAERALRSWAYDGAAVDADLVITLTRWSQERIVEVLGVDPQRIAVIPHGIDHDRFRPNVTGDLPFELPERFVLYPANLWRHKNHARLIDAMALAADRELSLVLSGATYNRLLPLMRRARACGVADRVMHVGYVHHDDFPVLLRRSSGVIFPSLYEGFGAPPLEAMACGVPVAVSGHGALAEVVGDAALLFDPHNPEEIADSIDRLPGSPLIDAGLLQAARFTWKAAAQHHIAAYERTIAVAT